MLAFVTSSPIPTRNSSVLTPLHQTIPAGLVHLHRRPSHTKCVQAPRRHLIDTSTWSPSKAKPRRNSSRPSPPFRPTAPVSEVSLPLRTSSPSLDTLIRETYRLASSSGALGRGIRASLRAFYRRASFLLFAARNTPKPDDYLYVEIGPAYVLATARMAAAGEKVTRYAVEQRAWPMLHNLYRWDEVSSSEARKRGAMLRHLREGGRFGRHLFISYNGLSAIVQVAEDLLEVAEERAEQGVAAKITDGLYEGLVNAGKSAAPWTGMEVEAVVQLRRRPMPGLRTVAANCPRGAAHSNGDRKPSLILWMNTDGITGGAMCPVCLEDETRGSMLSAPVRNMTWRVHYLPNNSAALCTPQRRIRSPARVQEAMVEYRRAIAEAKAMPVEPDEDTPNTELSDGDERPNASAGKLGDVSSKRPVGGCVLKDRKRISRVGDVIGMAYVTASLRVATTANTMGDVILDGNRLRTVGNMARQRCPMQVLLWSDRRSKGPTSSRKVEEVAWYARQSVGLSNDGSDVGYLTEGEVVESEEWLPTPLVSVSAMKPSAWRDIMCSTGRLISVPAAWEASVQAWVLFDIDNIHGLDKEGVVTESGNKLALAVRRDQELSGRCLVMQTGPTGLHVWAELREVRENPGTWFKKDETREWYTEIGSRLLQASHRAGSRGGKIDMSSCSAGRFARRPGWRLLEDGSLFRSQVVVYVPSRVRKRIPRLQ